MLLGQMYHDAIKIEKLQSDLKVRDELIADKNSQIEELKSNNIHRQQQIENIQKSLDLATSINLKLLEILNQKCDNGN